ncbi:hypothetical protein OAG63_01420 [Methylacidiphilales bacterium]|nr:hypothetical protein [Candidatus Methylacidiphilales bacterium]
MISALSGQPSRLLANFALFKRSLLVSTVIFLLLEIWRPCYFLTDDNLSVGFPFHVELGRHLKEGQSPFFSDYLFGGHYNLLRDCFFFTWHPIDFLVSLFADTSARFWMIDMMAFFYIMMATMGFATLGSFLREEGQLKLSDTRLLFYTLSFVYSTFILTAGSSWINYLANQSSLPWLALGILHPNRYRAMGLIALVSAHQILGGQMAATISNDLFLTLFAFGVAFYRRSALMFTKWVLGNILGLVLVSPLLIPAMEGFFQSERSSGLTPGVMTIFSVPGVVIPFSFFMGNYTDPIMCFTGRAFNDALQFPYIPTLLACAAAWCLPLALFSSARWHFLEILCLGMTGLLVLFIIRPDWMTSVMIHIPLLKSMRWPFREILQLQFFIHLLLVLRPQMGTLRFQNLVATSSLALFIIPFFFIKVPTFNPLAPDRQALFSGQAERFWLQVKTHLKPADEIATVIDKNLWQTSWRQVPYSLLGTANFPAFLKVKCISGYTNTAPLDAIPLKTHPLYWFGAFDRDQLDSILRERPDLKIISLDSLTPLKITLLSSDSPAIDLTPYLSQ